MNCKSTFRSGGLAGLMSTPLLLGALAILLFGLGFLAPEPSHAQTKVDFPGAIASWWYDANGTSATPDGACRQQHAALNPGAPYQPPTRTSDNTYACHWIASQYGGGPNANTILPFNVWLHCDSNSVHVRVFNGQCIDDQYQTSTCNCHNDPARGENAPPSPEAGGPVGPSGGDPSGFSGGGSTSSSSAGSGINIPTGYLSEGETDYSSGDGLFTVQRHYSSSHFRPFTDPPVGFGESWQGLIPGRLFIGDNQMNTISYTAGNGESQHGFTANSNDLTSWTYSPPAATRATLTMVTAPAVTRDQYFQAASVANGPAEFHLAFANGEYILYRRADLVPGETTRSAVPIEHGFASGYKQYFDYPDTGLFPNVVRDSFGRQMTLSWVDVPLNPFVTDPDGKGKAISSIALPDGTSLHYDYDEADWFENAAFTDTGSQPISQTMTGRKDRLVSVRHLDANGGQISKRSYLYEDTRYPYALTGIKNDAGQRLTTYTYDNAGFVASSERAGGVERYTYHPYYLQGWDSNYTFADVTNPLGRVETYSFYQDSYFRPSALPRWTTQISAAATANVPADVKSFNYTGLSGGGFKWSGQVASTVDARGTTTSYNEDVPNLRPSSVTEASGTPQQRVSNITWHPTLDLPTQIDRPGLRINYTYSDSGLLLSRTETDTTTQTVPYSTAGQTRTWTYNWDANGRLLSLNGPKPADAQGRDDVTTFVYDPSGNLQTATDGLGQVTAFAAYDANGRPGTMTDPNGVVTAFGYDGRGRTTTVTVKHPSDSSQDAVTSIDYDSEGRIIGFMLPATDKLFIDYNLAGQLTAIRAASGERIDFQNDAMSDVTSQTVKRSDGTVTRLITRTFDELGRMLTQTLGPGRTTNWAYDKNGNATLVTSARSFATQAAFDPLNRLVSTVAPDVGTATTAYDANDQIATNTDPKSVQTAFVRDGFGDVIQEVSPDRGTSTFYYNVAGELTASIDGRGQRVDYTHDILGRVLQKTPVGRPATETITYTWDTPFVSGSFGVGRLASVTDGTGTTGFGYDHRGNLTTKRQTLGSRGSADLIYAYDLADRVTQITYPSGRIIAYDRDAKGRVTGIRTKASASDAAWTSLANSVTYEPWGSITGAQFGNGLSLAEVWTDGLLTSKRLFNSASGANLSSLAYTYDRNGNVASVRDQLNDANSIYYGYDTNDRLTFASMNVPTPALSSATLTYTNGTNQLANMVDGSGTRSIVYDGRGNTISETRPGASTVATNYDGYGRLLAYVRTGDPAQANAYNGLDERVGVTSGSTSHTFVYDADERLIGEYDSATGTPIAETIWLSPSAGGDRLPIGGDDDVGGYAPLAVITGSGPSAMTYWVHGNSLGVPIVTSDGSGAVAAPAAHSIAGFPGQTQTLGDLYYNRYRDYDSSTGRYIQADPIGLGGGNNPFAYANDNPLRQTDPSGLSSLAIPLPRLVIPSCPDCGEIGAALAIAPYVQEGGQTIGGWIGDGVLAFRDAVNGGCGSGAGSSPSGGSNWEDECEDQYLKDQAECLTARLRGGKSAHQECLKTAADRYSECLRAHGVHGIRTSLYLGDRRW